MSKKLRTKDLVKLGWPKRAAGLAINVLATRFKRESDEWRHATLGNLLAHPDNFVDDQNWGGVATALGGRAPEEAGSYITPEILKSPGDFSIFESKAGIAPNAVQQLYDAMRPVSYTHLTLPTTPYV